MMDEDTHAGFSTTPWSLVGEARSDDPATAHAARDRLLRLTMPPVYAALRRRNRDREAAAEIAQAFFVDVVLSRDLFGRADAQRGRLRTFLLTALQRYETDLARRRAARPDRAGAVPLDLAHEDAFAAHLHDGSPEDAFDRRWAVAALEEALARCERALLGSELERHWRAFERFAIRPAIHGVERPALAALAEEHGFDSAQQLASAFKTVRRHLDAQLRAVAAETASEPAEAEAEYRHLVELILGHGA